MTVIERIKNDRDGDLIKLLDYAKSNGIPGYTFPGNKTLLLPCFQLVRNKAEIFANHKPVLTISIGGSNVKIMLASMKDGRVQVQQLLAKANPEVMTEFNDYFADLLLTKPEFKDYLNKDDAIIGVSIAVAIVNGIPLHPSKVPFVKNLIARDYKKDLLTHNFCENLQNFLTANKLKKAEIYLEGDCPLAHLGSVMMSGLSAAEPSFLSICGTGMATAEDEIFILFSWAKMLTAEDPELFPATETEGGQFQYCVAGKGLWSFMRRAVILKSKEAGSQLASAEVLKWFTSAADSKNVGLIWESALPDGGSNAKSAEIRASMPAAAFAELQELSLAIMAKAVSVFVNNTLATLICLGEKAVNKNCHIFIEGSIANNKCFYPRFKKELEERCADQQLFTKIDRKMPAMPVILNDVIKADPAGNLPAQLMREVDITSVGALSLAIAKQELHKN
nr:hypothetical protein [Desulfobulbaceae bacterium]